MRLENYYDHTKKIKKKYYDYFINDILNLKLQKQNILSIKQILSSNQYNIELMQPKFKL